MTIKIHATALTCLAAIWGSAVSIVILQTDAWWTLVVAALASLAVGFWRSIPRVRVLSIAAIWGSTAAIIAIDAGYAWVSVPAVSVPALFATGLTSFGRVDREAILSPLGITASWVAVAVAVVGTEGGAWITVFALLATGALANVKGHRMIGVLAILGWGVSAFLIILFDGAYWIVAIAFVLSLAHFSGHGLRIPTRFEWDFRSSKRDRNEADR